MKYFAGIDYLKGLLLLFVFLGHLLPGTLSENFVRYLIYSFHMPLFIGISGALLTPASLARSSLRQLVARYFGRMLLPWLVACVVYYPVNNIYALRQGFIPWQDTLSLLRIRCALVRRFDWGRKISAARSADRQADFWTLFCQHAQSSF